MKFSLPLKIISNSSLPTEFYLKTKTPFSVDNENFQLGPYQDSFVNVFFDPTHQVSRINTDFKGKLNIIHKNHPFKDFMDLIGSVEFPNLIFE